MVSCGNSDGLFRCFHDFAQRLCLTLGGDEMEGDSSCFLVLLERGQLGEAKCGEITWRAMRAVKECPVPDSLNCPMSKADISQPSPLKLMGEF